MKKTLILVTTALVVSIHLNAQNKTEFFTIDLPDSKIANSLYDQIDFIDIRRDTSYFGGVQVGLANAKAKVEPKPAWGNN